jgi:nitronate monooxygenase/enoyl-[acyl-carrier protein] reductase II
VSPTALCNILGIEIPVVQAAIWPAASPRLVAAVGEAGAIGSLGAVFGSAQHLRAEIAAVRELTDRPFIVNHVISQLDRAAFEATLDERPTAISFALGDPGELVARAHDAGTKVIHQVHNVDQARAAADLGVDAIIAQGAEAGGQGMLAGVGGLALVPQVVDAVTPTPVIAAGGIADGRGLAAALMLGAAGVNIGTRFLASHEASAHASWKQQIVAARSEEAVRFEAWTRIFPPAPTPAYPVVPRVLSTQFVEQWQDHAGDARAPLEDARAAVQDAIARGVTHELLPFTGQSAGLIAGVLPAAEIVRRMVSEAEAALTHISPAALFSAGAPRARGKALPRL